MANTQVEVVGPDGQRQKMVESSFNKVWATRGWRLASEVDAEKAAEPEEADGETGGEAGGTETPDGTGTPDGTDSEAVPVPEGARAGRGRLGATVAE